MKENTAHMDEAMRAPKAEGGEALFSDGTGEPAEAIDETGTPADARGRMHGGETRKEVISTNMTVNLICTLASLNGALGLFFLYADRRFHAVRRYAVQSTALLFAYVAGAALCFLTGTLLGLIPIAGAYLRWAVNALWAAGTVLDVFLRVRMMLRAYAGEAYELPLIGRHARTFE